MNPQARAIIRWVPASRGGRKAPPPDATGFTTPVRFESDAVASRGWWSLRIIDARQLHGSEVLDARVAFVMPEAPHDLLKEGERFELLEGPRVVAKAVVLPTAIEPPDRISEFELALLG